MSTENTDPTELPDCLDLCLDIFTPCTLAAMLLDHQYYIARHQSETDADRWGDLDMVQQDADAILLHLTDTHFSGDPAQSGAYLAQQEKTHIPF